VYKLNKCIIFSKKPKKEDQTMENQALTVQNITCGHCVMSIKNELSELEGIRNVEGDPENKIITVEWDSPATLEMIKETLKEINYPAE